MVLSSVFLALAWFFWICTATQQELHHIDASLIRASHIDCDEQHRAACDTLQRSAVDADRTVHGFLLLPESKSHWQAFPVGLLLSQQSTSAREGSATRIVFLTIGLVCVGALAYYLSHADTPEEQDHDDAPFSKSSPWEEAYQNARGDLIRKDCFDLLFRTGIVPKIDRSSEIVNRGHIERMVLVAEEMLREKPLKVWLEESENTRRVFEDRLADAYKTSPPATTGATTPMTPMQDNHVPSLMSSPLMQERTPAMHAYEVSPQRTSPREDAMTTGTSKAIDETPLNKFMGDDESAGHLRDTPAFATIAHLPQGESRFATQEHKRTGTPPFPPMDTVSTVAAVDCGKKSTPSSNSPASTVPVLDLAKKSSPMSTVPTLDERRSISTEGANSTSIKSPRQKFFTFPKAGSVSSASMPATVPILEEREGGSSPLQPSRPPLSMQLPRTSNPRGNESEGWPVVMKFPSKPSSASWEGSAARSLEQRLKRPD